MSEGHTDTTASAEVAQASSPIDLTWKYRWAMSNVDIDVAKEQELTGVKKYWGRATQVKMELDWLHDWIPVLAIFVRHSQRIYDNKEIG